jgi:hypothetical protein
MFFRFGKTIFRLGGKGKGMNPIMRKTKHQNGKNVGNKEAGVNIES